MLFVMLREYHIKRRGEAILLMMAVESAVLDVETDEKRLRECLTALDAPHRGLVSMQLGRFGSFDVTLNIHPDESLSVFIDGPDFEESFSQAAAIWISNAEMRRVIHDALSGET